MIYDSVPVAAEPRKRAVVGWVLYDLANTIFAMGVVSMQFSLWVRERVGEQRADSVYGLVTAVSMAGVFLLAPILGSMTDRAPRRLPFLIVSTVGCVALTAILGRVGWWGTLAAFVAANALYQAGQQFYDSLLPAVSTPENRGRVGGLGVGIGYLGSFVAIGLGLLAPRLDLGKEALFSLFALLFLLFSLPCFLFVKEPKNPDAQPVWSLRATAEGLRRTWLSLKNSSQCPGLGRFLLVRMLYTDPINTVIAVMTLYSVNVAIQGGVSQKYAERTASLVMLCAVVFAVAGGLVWGRLVDRYGARRLLGVVLWLWIATFFLAGLLSLLGLPWQLLLLVGIMAGLALGGTWSADRPLMLELTPPPRVGEFYGLYGMVGRFAAVVGPLVWGLVTGALISAGWSPVKSQGAAVLVLLLFVAAARLLLQPLLLRQPDAR